MDVLRLYASPRAVDDARLLVTELTSNAVRHGRGGEVRVSVRVRGGRLRCLVEDQGRGFAVRKGRDAGQVGGWGLELVDELASRWAVERGSTRVWFELPLDR